ncbi:hypothetical protein HII28_15395 [Planctomonas sp. JC2975]|uniref:hypothetical protein n=1 Tax=Planctomonas sp. JC2975 TaxID=2729626 RepID=UPI001473970C|nr:hypothetical protein [Planctomonas sp. JC2975]NNC13259.1 hypothetical protein [Planctomonas sp. JC2975]
MGLAIVVLTYMYGAKLGDWSDRYAGTPAEYAAPTVTLLFGVAGLGLLLLIGGVLSAVMRPTKASTSSVDGPN